MDRPTTSPRFTLALLLLAAALILGAGLVLSRREETVRVMANRESLIQFADDLQNELRRLEELHEHHVERIAREVSADDRVQVARDCEAVVGIARCSFLAKSSGRQDQHVSVGPVRGGSLPLPALELPTTVKPSDFIVLDAKQFLDQSERDHGWFKRPGGPLYFWLRRNPTQLRVLTIQPREVRAVLNKSISEWVLGHAASLIFSNDDECLTSPEGDVIPTTERHQPTSAPANWVMRLPTRYGTWILSAWDRVEVRRSMDKATLVAASSIAAFVAVLSGLIFIQQRRALNQAAERVSFVNRVSHELRTPLTNIVLNLDVAADSLQDESPQAAQRLGLVREEAGRLARLIDNVLAFSRLEQGKHALRPIEGDPQAIVDGVVSQFASSFQRRGISVKRETSTTPVRFAFDSDALAQITANLLSNVEKYAPGVPVVIKTWFDNGAFTLSVADTGPGIPEGGRDRVFLPFERLNSQTSEGISGTGLGLSIARDLAVQMGGELKLVEGTTGAEFVFCLPIKPRTEPT